MNNRFKLLATPLGLLVQSVAFAVLGILFFAAPAFVIRFCTTFCSPPRS